VRIELDGEVEEDLRDFYSDATGFSAGIRETLADMEKGSVLYQYTVWWNHADQPLWTESP